MVPPEENFPESHALDQKNQAGKEYPYGVDGTS